MNQRRILTIVMMISSALVKAETSWLKTEEFTFELNSGKIAEIILDIDIGELTVSPWDSSGKCHVLLQYDQEEFDASAQYRETSNTVKVRLDKDGWMSNWDDAGEHSIRAEIMLPKDIDINLDAHLKAGEVMLDLGGLRLQNFRLSIWAGETTVQFNEPNLIEMKMMDIKTNIGELNTHCLGNARFLKARINGGIGEIDVDLTGELSDRAMAKIDLDIGEAQIILPLDRGVRLSVGGFFGFLSSKNIDTDFTRRGRYYYTDNYDDNAEKNLSVRVTPGLGELNIYRE